MSQRRLTITQTPGMRLLINRSDVRLTRFAADPDAPASRSLLDGEARLEIERFALTANNVTYAVFGEAMKYWQFFPAQDALEGCLPVWGFATVTESRLNGLEPGRRVYGFLPAGTHLVVKPKISDRGFADLAPHREALAAVYNQYVFCDADPVLKPDLEGLQAVLQPLFTTSFLIDDFLASNRFFGARRLLISSASSKTAYGTAFCLTERSASEGAARTVALTSAANVDFVRSLGCYDEVRRYDELASLDTAEPTVYVDFAGNAVLRRAVHERFASNLLHSSSIGGTHWDEIGSAGGLPGPRPTLFFAPTQFMQRSLPPPEGLGRAELERRLAAAWQRFIARVADVDEPWLQMVSQQGAAAIDEVYISLLAGRSNPRAGHMLTLLGHCPG